MPNLMPTEWRERLQLYGLDLRNIPAVEAFARHLLDTEPSLDIVIHNAAQTIRRPPGFYRELAAQEQRPQETLPGEARRLVAQGAPSTLALSDSSAAAARPPGQFLRHLRRSSRREHLQTMKNGPTRGTQIAGGFGWMK